MTQVQADIACLTCDISSIGNLFRLLKVTFIWSSQVGNQTGKGVKNPWDHVGKL